MIRLLAAACLCLLPSCQTLDKLLSHEPKKPAKDSTAPKEQPIGTIELVNPEQRFVLVRTAGDLLIAPGTELYSTNSLGEAVKLKVTPERKGSYLTADIIAGNPQRQDIVVYRAISQQPPLPGAEAIVRGDVTKVGAAPPTPAVQPAPALPLTEPAPNEFLRPIPFQPPPQP